ncbi:MAG: Abi family protein [Tenericutes bacterium]|nr:Abi family protein [Mycoplasmatota bacterium]
MRTIELNKNISKIDYVHHIYPQNTQYGDILRKYKFEHELRNMLLKYTLIIEESIKNVFIKHINNTPDVKTNFLSDINNYDTSKGNNDALDTLKLIFEKQKK